jgi:hypothetical protein
MHNLKKHYFKLAIFTLLCSVTISVTAGVDKKKPNQKNMISWIKRPWAWRYLMFISPDWANHKKYDQGYNEQVGPKALDQRWKPLFDVTHFFPSNDKTARPGSGISVVVIEFDKDGKVTTPNAFGKPLHGRIHPHTQVTLAEGNPGVHRQFDIGYWFPGLGDASTHWAPSICSYSQLPSTFATTNAGYLYGPANEISRRFSTVGCREWAYQIKDPGRPYIDVTSYIPERFDPHGPGTYIQETIGWAGFEDHKPVIGKQDDDWYCLHDCPGDDQPGVIPDIKAWAAKNGWKAPQPPTRVPVFPDPPARSGYYP